MMFELSMSTVLYSCVYCLNVSCALFHCTSGELDCFLDLYGKIRASVDIYLEEFSRGSHL